MAAAAPAAPGTVRFTSRAGYSLAYPAGWHPHGWAGDRHPAQFLILSPGPGAEGVVIGPHQAAIAARVQAPGESVPPDARPVAPPPGATADCRAWAKQEAEDNVGPDDPVDPAAVQAVTSLFCRAGDGRVVRVQLTRWAGDRSRPAWRRTLDAVAGSLRLAPAAAPRR